MSRFLRPDTAKPPGRVRRRESMLTAYYEQYPQESDDEGRWARVGEIDPRTGRWLEPPDWPQCAKGRRPLSEFLRYRAR